MRKYVICSFFFSPDISLLVSVPDHGQLRQNILTLLGYLGSAGVGQWAAACQYVSRLDDFW